MNKEDAKNREPFNYETFEDSIVEKVYNRERYFKNIDEIYNDFDSRTCDNCKYLHTEICQLGIQHFEINTDPDKFGCNKFKRKEK